MGYTSKYAQSMLGDGGDKKKKRTVTKYKNLSGGKAKEISNRRGNKLIDVQIENGKKQRSVYKDY